MRSLPLGRRPSVSPANICWAGTLDRPCDNFVRQGKSASWVVGVESKDETSNLIGLRESTPIRGLHVSGGADDLCVSKSTRSTGRAARTERESSWAPQTGASEGVREGRSFRCESDEASVTSSKTRLRKPPTGFSCGSYPNRKLVSASPACIPKRSERDSGLRAFGSDGSQKRQGRTTSARMRWPPSRRRSSSSSKSTAPPGSS